MLLPIPRKRRRREGSQWLKLFRAAVIFLSPFVSIPTTAYTLIGPDKDQLVECVIVRATKGKENVATQGIRNSGEEVRPLFSMEVAQYRADKDELSRYLYVKRRGIYGSPELAQRLATIGEVDGVETVFAEPRPMLASGTPTTTPDFGGQQSYLDIDAMDVRRAWSTGDLKAGSFVVPPKKVNIRGEGVNIYDIEFGWLKGHEDLPAFSASPSNDFDEQQHGTAVGGILVAKDNGYGVLGIANAAKLQYFGITSCLSDALSAAIGGGKRGEVVLIEVQMPQEGGAAKPYCSCNVAQCGGVPAEYWDPIRVAITAAAKSGIVVVEAAGNGSVDLDLVTKSDGTRPFAPPLSSSPGAILVAAGRPFDDVPMCFTNWGTAVDLESWGEKVVTTGGGTLFHPGGIVQRYYTASFGGTSSAAAIIAGMVADVESAAESICGGGRRLDVVEMLSLLRGTGKTGSSSKYIGVRPDLFLAVSALKQEFCP